MVPYDVQEAVIFSHGYYFRAANSLICQVSRGEMYSSFYQRRRRKWIHWY